VNNIATTIFLGIGLAITLLFGGIYFSKENYQAATWWFLGAWISIGLGAAFQVQGWLAERMERNRLSIADRPYIDVLNPTLAPLAVGQVPAVAITLENTGNTPAVDIQVAARLRIGAIPLFPADSYPIPEDRPITLGRGQRFKLVITGEHPLSADELDGLRPEWVMQPMRIPNGTIFNGRQLKVNGEVAFCATGNVRPLPRVHFCFVYDPVSQRMIVCDSFGNYEDRARFRDAMNCRQTE
jgi:hypothetical protein